MGLKAGEEGGCSRVGACCEVVAPWWGSQCHSSGLIIQDMEVSVGTRYFHPHVSPEPRGVLFFPEGLDVYADGPVRLISVKFGAHIAPCGEVQASPGASSPATRCQLCRAPPWGAWRSWWMDSPTPSPRTWGRLCTPQDPVPHLATGQGPPRALPREWPTGPLQRAWNLVPGGTPCLSLLAPQGAGGSRVSCKPPSPWWVLGFPLTISLLPLSARW